MPTGGTSARGGLVSRLPWGVTLGFALVSFAYSAAILTDTITDPILSDVWAIMYFAVAVGLLVRAVRLHRQP